MVTLVALLARHVSVTLVPGAGGRRRVCRERRDLHALSDVDGHLCGGRARSAGGGQRVGCRLRRGDILRSLSRATVPTPLSMVTVSAFSSCQLSVECWPETMLAGVAVKRMMRGGAAGVVLTVTDTVQTDVWFPAPVAVMVYCVDCVGLTTKDPLVPIFPETGRAHCHVRRIFGLVIDCGGLARVDVRRRGESSQTRESAEC